MKSGGGSSHHLRLDLQPLVAAKESVVDEISVVARDVGSGPDRIHDVQVGLRDEPQSTVPLLGVDRRRTERRGGGRRDCAAENLAPAPTSHPALHPRHIALRLETRPVLMRSCRGIAASAQPRSTRTRAPSFFRAGDRLGSALSLGDFGRRSINLSWPPAGSLDDPFANDRLPESPDFFSAQRGGFRPGVGHVSGLTAVTGSDTDGRAIEGGRVEAYCLLARIAGSLAETREVQVCKVEARPVPSGLGVRASTRLTATRPWD